MLKIILNILVGLTMVFFNFIVFIKLKKTQIKKFIVIKNVTETNIHRT